MWNRIKQDKKVKLSLIITAGVVLLFSVYLVWYKMQYFEDNYVVRYTENLTELADKFYSDYNGGEYGKIYDNMTDTIFKSRISRNDFIDSMEKSKAVLGKVKVNVLAEYEWKKGSMGRFCEMRYVVKRETQGTFETLTFRNENGKWLLVDYVIKV